MFCKIHPNSLQFASASCREAFGTSRPGSGLLPPNPTLLPMPNFLTPPPPPPRPVGPPPIPWRSCKPMAWRVPPVGGSYSLPPPFNPRCPSSPFFAKPSFLLSRPGAGPAAEAARASVYNYCVILAYLMFTLKSRQFRVNLTLCRAPLLGNSNVVKCPHTPSSSTLLKLLYLNACNLQDMKCRLLRATPGHYGTPACLAITVVDA